MRSEERNSTVAIEPGLTYLKSWPRMRALSWSGEALYASRGYTLFKGIPADSQDITWTEVGHFKPEWWRRFTSAGKLTYRLCRDGFHALAVLSSGDLVAAVPGAIITMPPDADEFRVSHRVTRGTRPLYFAATRSDQIFFGEYFGNSERDEVHIYCSQDRGKTWDVAYTFPKGAIRHVHNVLYDKWTDCLYILTGDLGEECKILRASCDFKEVEVVLSGNQQARAVSAIVTEDAIYFATDTPLEANYVYRLDRSGEMTRLSRLNNSSLYGCQVGSGLFFSTMVEPSEVNPDRHVYLYGSWDGKSWRSLLKWRKDRWHMLFQFGNAILPTGENHTDLLALTCVAVEGGDLQTSLWRTTSEEQVA